MSRQHNGKILKLQDNTQNVSIPGAPHYLLENVETESVTLMPRGGSKKGEHRGAAKREAKKRGPPKGVSGNPNGRPKGSQNKAIRERLAIIGAEIGVAALDGMMPKDCLLKCMRTFMQMAEKELTEFTAEQAKSDDDRDDRKVDLLVGAYERHIILAGDMAYKAASYYHPRLQALMVGGATDKSPGDVLRSMLEEIDDEARSERQQARQIEHQPTEPPVEVLPLKAVNEG